jgi:hypothetical protein
MGENRKRPEEHFEVVEKLIFYISECNFSPTPNPAVSSKGCSRICNFRKKKS